jgi:hypothetical protein
MKRKILMMLLLVIAVANFLKVNAQGLVITSKDGTERNIQLESIQNLAFANGNLMVRYTAGSTEAINLTTIRKLYFNPLSTGISEPAIGYNSAKISVYPNPAGNYINFQNIQDNEVTVIIYRTDGSIALQAQISSTGKSIDISQLKYGIYLVRINNQVLKLIKL